MSGFRRPQYNIKWGQGVANRGPLVSLAARQATCQRLLCAQLMLLTLRRRRPRPTCRRPLAARGQRMPIYAWGHAAGGGQAGCVLGCRLTGSQHVQMGIMHPQPYSPCAWSSRCLALVCAQSRFMFTTCTDNTSSWLCHRMRVTMHGLKAGKLVRRWRSVHLGHPLSRLLGACSACEWRELARRRGNLDDCGREWERHMQGGVRLLQVLRALAQSSRS